MFQVFDNGKPADKTGFAWATTWENSKFKTLDEAFLYAYNWLGFGAPLELNVPYDYSGYGDILEVREIGD